MLGRSTEGTRWLHRGRPARRTAVLLAAALATILAASLLAPATTSAQDSAARAGLHAHGATRSANSSASGAIPQGIVDRYLAVRPALGDVTVVTVSGESADRKLLAATFQGVVNRTQVRVYLVGMRAEEIGRAHV